MNRDAAFLKKGITAFPNSEISFRRWSVTLTQRGMALSEVHELAGVQSGEQPSNKLNKWRILRDNADMDALTHSLESLCDALSTDQQNSSICHREKLQTKKQKKNFFEG